MIPSVLFDRSLLIISSIRFHKVSNGRIASGPASPTPCKPCKVGRIVGELKIPPSAFHDTEKCGIVTLPPFP